MSRRQEGGEHKGLFASKTVDATLAETQEEGHRLAHSLGGLDLIFIGIGALIGTGIFVLTGVGALHAGPAVALSFLLAGVVSSFAALTYSEMASTVPVSGSAYTYSYATMGELIAWIIGWDLLLEYGVACSTVAVGWSGYFDSILAAMGVHVPPLLAAGPLDPQHPGLFNLPALGIVLVLTWLLSHGTRLSSNVNNIIVAVKLAVIVLFIVVAIFHVNPVNWHPFAPFGFSGIAAGASLIFFAYIGFDAISTAAEEARHPQHDLPIGLIGSLSIVTILYIVVSLFVTGLIPFRLLANQDAPVAYALQYVGVTWGAAAVSVGALAGLTTVILIDIFASSRVMFAMSRDGLLPPAFARVSSKTKVPLLNTWTMGVGIAVIAALSPLNLIAEMANIGTLFAFLLVGIGVIYLRQKQPDLPRPFRVPGYPVIPALSVIASFYLMINLPKLTWARFGGWLVIGLLLYLFYGYRHSRLRLGTLPTKQKK